VLARPAFGGTSEPCLPAGEQQNASEFSKCLNWSKILDWRFGCCSSCALWSA
jgi:hypothetical protein